MRKIILFLSAFSMVFAIGESGFAQGRVDDDFRRSPGRDSANVRSGFLGRLATRVESVVHRHGADIDRKDQREVRRSLRQILRLFEQYGYRPGPTRPPVPPPIVEPEPEPVPQPVRQLLCDTQNNKLVDLRSGVVIYDFSDRNHCQEGLDYVRRGEPFCDYKNNTLWLSDPLPVRLVHDFSDSDDCRQGREAVMDNRPFCDFKDNTLRHPTGELIYDFSNGRDCENARDNWQDF